MAIDRKLAQIKDKISKKFVIPPGCEEDPRILDLEYELYFSSQKLDEEPKENSLNNARNLIFKLPEFKSAEEAIALTEDQVTRELSLLEGIVKCRLCQSTNTTFTHRQMHSSDEPPTLLVYCASCHHRTTHTGE